MTSSVNAQSKDYRFAVCVKENGKWGLVDATGKRMVPSDYENFLPSAEGLIAAQKGDKWGFITPQGKEVTAFAYDSVQHFSEGMAAVMIEPGECKWGFIDRQGKLVIPCSYELGFASEWGDMHQYGFKEGLVAVGNQQGKWGCLDKSGNLAIQFVYDTVSDFENGVAHATIESEKGIREGIINKKGVLVVPMHESKWEDWIIGLVRKEKKLGLCDESGNIVIPILYDKIKYGEVDGTYYVFSGSIVGIYAKDAQNQWHYRGCSEPENLFKSLKRVERDSLLGYVDSKNNERIPAKYSKIEKYCLRTSSFSYGFKWSATIFSGRKIIGIVQEYPTEQIWEDDGIKIDEGYVEKYELHLYPYSPMREDGNFMISVEQNGKWGFYCLLGETSFVPCDYDDKDFVASIYANVRCHKTPQNMYMCVKKNDKWGLINMEGRIVVPIEYEQIKTICY